MPYRKLGFALSVACVFASVYLAPGAAVAQAWPDKPIRVIVPVGPGGGFDVLARTTAPVLADRLRQPVTVENRPGAGSLIGTDAVAKAPHDGYTLLVGGLSNMAINGGLYKQLPYDSVADFRPVSISVSYALCLVARKGLPQGSLQEVIAFAKINPGKVSYGSVGLGSAQHIAGALLAQMSGTTMIHVPYKGAGPAQQDLLGERIDLFWNNCGAVKPLIDNDQVKPLAVSGRERTAALRNLPTVLETGVAPFEFDSWIGFFVGARTPQPIVDRLRSEIAAVITSPDYVARVERDGGRVLRMSGAESEAFVKSEAERWRKLIPQVGIQPE